MTERALILVVDDDERAARMLAQMLREDGWEAEVACDGAGAKDRLARAPRPAVLVADLHLSRGGGADIVRFAQTQIEAVAVVVVTGYPHLVPRDLAPQPVVLTKPLVYRELTAALERFAPAQS
jgi:CheY-like chemotaxis protein